MKSLMELDLLTTGHSAHIQTIPLITNLYYCSVAQIKLRGSLTVITACGTVDIRQTCVRQIYHADKESKKSEKYFDDIGNMEVCNLKKEYQITKHFTKLTKHSRLHGLTQ